MSKDFEIKIENYPGYDTAEISYVIKLLCQCKSNSSIQRLFKKFTGSKSISDKLIEQIRMDYAKRIVPNANFYRNNTKGSIFGNPRLLADLFEELCEECREDHIIRFDPNGDPVMGPDHTNAIRAASEGSKMVLAWEKFIDSKKKDAKSGLPKVQSLEDAKPQDAEEVTEDSWEIYRG